jgi:hypothetical protein
MRIRSKISLAGERGKLSKGSYIKFDTELAYQQAHFGHQLSSLLSRDGCRIVAQQTLKLIQEELTKEQKKFSCSEKINTRCTRNVRAMA